MGVIDLLFGARPTAIIDAAPLNANWRSVRPRETGSPVRAWRAEADCNVETEQGELHADAGEDYIVAHGPENRGVVRGDIFARTYEPLGGGLYRKRTDVIYRYFTRSRPVVVETPEGPRKAQPGDWIMEGLEGELWPVPRAEAEKKYEPL